MSIIKLITDSGSDITYENEQRYGIQIIPFKVVMGDQTYISRIDFDNEKFYEMVDKFDGVPTTVQITPYEFVEIFEEHYKNGYTDIINVSINSAGSGTHSNAVVASEIFFENHPEAKETFSIYNIDSLSYTAGYGYAVVEAAKMLENGAEAKEVVAYIKDWCEHMAAYFALYTLKYAAKSGRIPNVARYFGDALGLKPIMSLRNREITVSGKVRGEKNIIPKLAENALVDIEKNSPYCIIYGNDSLVRDDMVEYMTKMAGYPPADIYQIGGVITANSGPKLIGIVYRHK